MAERFLQAAAVRFDAQPKRFGKAALERLRNHDWPGNVRELANLCWRLAALAPGDTNTPADLDGMLAASRPMPAPEGDDALSAWARARLAAGESGDRTGVRWGQGGAGRVDLGG